MIHNVLQTNDQNVDQTLYAFLYGCVNDVIERNVGFEKVKILLEMCEKCNKVLFSICRFLCKHVWKCFHKI